MTTALTVGCPDCGTLFTPDSILAVDIAGFRPVCDACGATLRLSPDMPHSHRPPMTARRRDLEST